MSIISVEDVSFSYGKGNTALTDFSMSVEKGEYVAVIGHNGSGKSTLAKILNGLIKPTKGEVVVDGLSSNDKNNLFEIRKRVGVVFQNPDNQLVASIVEDDVAFGPENLGVKREEIGERIEFALKSVGMEKYRHVSPTRLSGGQKQRIAIAGVLALKPKILVLDESTAMLDPQGRKEILEVAHKLNREQGVTIIAITHYMEEVIDADKIVVLSDGQKILEGTPKEIFDNIGLIKGVGLELPLPAYLAEKMREQGIPVKEGILTEKELGEELCRLLQRT